MTRALAVRRATAAYAGFGAVISALILLVLLLVGVGIVVSVIVALVLGAVAATALHLVADAMALRALGARPTAPGEFPQLENLVEGLSVAHGFRMPELHVVEDAAPNAAVVGRTPRHGALVVTTGLLERLRRIELEGILAQELSRIRSRESLTNVTAATLVGRLVGFSSTVSSRLARHLLEPDGAVRADLAGAELTRYPPGLAAALSSMRADGRVVMANPRAYRHLWVNVPDDAIAEQSFTLDDRIAVLHEL